MVSLGFPLFLTIFVLDQRASTIPLAPGTLAAALHLGFDRGQCHRHRPGNRQPGGRALGGTSDLELWVMELERWVFSLGSRMQLLDRKKESGLSDFGVI